MINPITLDVNSNPIATEVRRTQEIHRQKTKQNDRTIDRAAERDGAKEN